MLNIFFHFIVFSKLNIWAVLSFFTFLHKNHLESTLQKSVLKTRRNSWTFHRRLCIRWQRDLPNQKWKRFVRGFRSKYYSRPEGKSAGQKSRKKKCRMCALRHPTTVWRWKVSSLSRNPWSSLYKAPNRKATSLSSSSWRLRACRRPTPKLLPPLHWMHPFVSLLVLGEIVRSREPCWMTQAWEPILRWS